MKWCSKRLRAGFYVPYAVLFMLSIALACGVVLNAKYGISQAEAQLHAKAQLELYARSIKQSIMLCVEKKGIDVCKEQVFNLPNGYYFQSNLTAINDNITLLDIYGAITNPASTNLSRISRRYVLLR